MNFRETTCRDREVRKQPDGIGVAACANFATMSCDFLLDETIEKEMRDDQVVGVLLGRPDLKVFVQKTNARVIVNARFRQLQHARARIDTIDADCRMPTQERFKKTPVPLACNQCPPGVSDLTKKSNTRRLKGVSEREYFKCAICGAMESKETSRFFSTSLHFARNDKRLITAPEIPGQTAAAA